MKKKSLLLSIRHLVNALLILVFLGHASHRLTVPVLYRLDNLAYDFRLKTTLVNSIDPRIVIIDIDEKSLAEQGQWPWSRDKLARLVDILFDHYHIDLLGFDILFSEPNNAPAVSILHHLSQLKSAANPELQASLSELEHQYAYDDILAESFRNRAVVLSFFTSLKPEAVNPKQSLPTPIAEASDWAFSSLLPKAISIGANLTSLQQAASHAGYFDNPMVDQDGIYRRIPLLTQYNQNIYEAFSLAMYRTLLGSPTPEIIAEDSYKGGTPYLEGIKLLDYTIPTDVHSAILVPYRGKQNSFKYFSASDILNQTIENNALSHKIVLVGTTAAGLMDLRSTPVQNVYPGVEIHANIISGLMDQAIKSKPGYLLAVEFFELLVIAILSISFFSYLPPWGNVLLFVAQACLISVANFYLWRHLNVDSLLGAPLLLLNLLFANQFLFGYILESSRKKQLNKIFGLYVPPELVDQMTHSDEHFDLKGESRDMTVLFSDIRGFSGISETLEPQELCELINEILTPVTNVIHKSRGTIDKYIGDAVMAFWGAPLRDSQHAYHAISAALNIKPVITEINRKFLKRHWPEINIGIGINSGKMSVGNMGSRFRMAYTVMGDAVNLGSRLEGLTKEYGVMIIVSESSKLHAPQFVYRELDRVTVKGKKNPVTIYEPLGIADELTDEDLAQLPILNRALTHYKQSEWLQAEQFFRQLTLINPEDKLFGLYLERIAYFKTHPPAPDWQGVFVHTSK